MKTLDLTEVSLRTNGMPDIYLEHVEYLRLAYVYLNDRANFDMPVGY